MSNLSNEIVEKLVNSKNLVLYEYGLKNTSMEKLIDLFENKKNISFDEVTILSERLLAERDTEYVKENSHRLLKIDNKKLLENVIEVSSLEKLGDGLKEVKSRIQSWHLDMLNNRLRSTCCEEDTKYVQENAVRFLFFCNVSDYDSDVEEKCIQTIVDVSSTPALLSTLNVSKYMGIYTYVNMLIKRLTAEKDTDMVKDACEKLYRSDCLETRRVVASIAQIDILEKMIDVEEESDYVARVIVSRLKELTEEDKESN